jgi:hypothetical protein
MSSFLARFYASAFPQGVFVDSREVEIAFDFRREQKMQKKLYLALLRGLHSKLESLHALIGSRIQPFTISMSIEDLERRARENAGARENGVRL